MLVAIDTSTALTGVACYDERGLLGECTWHSGRNHTAHLLAQLALLMEHIQRRTADVQAVVVALGPGSWSGLRVGMSVAKGMALAGGLVLLGIGTLDTLAYQQQQAMMTVYPLIRLGRERFATARYEYTDRLQRCGAYANLTLTEVCSQLDGRTLLCGDIDADVQATLRDRAGEWVCFPPLAANLRRPGYLAELGWQRFVAGERDNMAQLEPFYLGEAVRGEVGGV